MEYEICLKPEEWKEIKRDLKVQEKTNPEIKDSLAIERTSFSNKRTFLAYLRTSLSLIIAGVSASVFQNFGFYVNSSYFDSSGNYYWRHRVPEVCKE